MELPTRLKRAIVSWNVLSRAPCVERLAVRCSTDIRRRTQGTVFDQYLISLYWINTVLSTTGLIGAMSPTNEPEVVFTIVTMVINLTVYSYVLGQISDAVRMTPPPPYPAACAKTACVGFRQHPVSGSDAISLLAMVARSAAGCAQRCGLVSGMRTGAGRANRQVEKQDEELVKTREKILAVEMMIRVRKLPPEISEEIRSHFNFLAGGVAPPP